ncbi:hypothetical protein FA95DRAFT_904382 [Auriscalpium vulgare]|uniref:Uncharacterized protein n=1 Tax=Auriscalpium vulgare TaxID=40419 RepID=A0ACB8R7T0_9AGAM|nr:hypothetical protein FA95DRAFT_904382 [Auriscalpium vulgare]
MRKDSGMAFSQERYVWIRYRDQGDERGGIEENVRGLSQVAEPRLLLADKYGRPPVSYLPSSDDAGCVLHASVNLVLCNCGSSTNSSRVPVSDDPEGTARATETTVDGPIRILRCVFFFRWLASPPPLPLVTQSSVHKHLSWRAGETDLPEVPCVRACGVVQPSSYAA